MTLPRIASLVPSLTELLFALGLGPQLVARTGFCIHPADAVRAVPKVGGTKDVNLAKLMRLAPTHVLVNVDENRLETVQALIRTEGEVILVYRSSGILGLPIYDRYVLGQQYCMSGEVARGAGVPTVDKKYCPVRKCVESEIFRAR